MGQIKKENKVWGSEEEVVNTEKYCGKILNVTKGARSSIKHHKNQDKTFYLFSGKVFIEINGKQQFVLKEKEAIRIPPGTKHRFTGLKDSIIIEFSTHHEEGDSYRDKESEIISKEEFKQLLRDVE